MNLIDFLEAGSSFAQDKTAVVEAGTGRHITYAELWRKTHALSSEFKNLGLRKNDRVILALQNSIEWIISFLSCVDSGAVAVPVLPTVTAFDLKKAIVRTKPALLIGDSSLINRSLPFDLLDEGERVVILNKKLVLKKTENARINKLDHLMSRSSESTADSRICRPQDSDLVSVNFTYRGFGYPVGATLSHSNFMEGIRAYVKTAGFSKCERILAIAPFFYIYPLVGCVLAPLYTGSTIVISHSIAANKLWRIIKRYNVNVLTGTPSFYMSLLSHVNSDTDTSGINIAFSGGSLLSGAQYRQVREGLKIDLRQGYGLTECMPVTCNPPFSRKPESLGTVLVGSEAPIAVSVVDESGRPKKAGEVGEIAVSGPTLTRGYFGMTKEFDSACRNNWFLTGDLGYLDTEGYLFFSGLKKRITKVGGNMVDLLEVENRLSAIPGVKTARVYSVPDSRWGQVVATDLALADEGLDERKIRQRLKAYLATYKIPKVFHKIP